MTNFLKKHYWIFISLVIVLLDQLSKYVIVNTIALNDEITVIPDFFSLTYIRNEGIAFGMLSRFGDTSKIFVALLTTALIVFACVLLFKGIIKDKIGVWLVAMIIGGGIGNLIDRVLLHYVVDFFGFTFFGKDFAVFNVADIFVTCGTILFVIYFLWAEAQNEKKGKENAKADLSDN